MGGKSSKAKPQKKGKKSKGQKDLDGLTGPDGKYEEQQTLPRPDLNFDGSNVNLNLDGSNANLANGAKLDISTDSIPNADLDLETTDVKVIAQTTKTNILDEEKKVSQEVNQISQSFDAKADDISSDAKRTSEGISNDISDVGNNVSTRVSQEVNQVSESADAKAEEISSDIKRTSQGISNDISETGQNVSTKVAQDVDEVSENVETKASEISSDIKRTSQGISNDITDAEENLAAEREKLSENVDQEIEDVNKTTDDAGYTAQVIGIDASGHLLQNGKGFADSNVDVANDFSADVNDSVQSSGADIGEAVETEASNISTFSQTVSLNVAQDANELNENLSSEVDNASVEFRNSLEAEASGISESVAVKSDEVESESQGLSAEVTNSTEINALKSEVESEIEGLRNSEESSAFFANEVSEDAAIKADDTAENVDEKFNEASSTVQNSDEGGANYANQLSRDISSEAEAANEEVSEPRISVANLRKSFEGGALATNTHNSFEKRASNVQKKSENVQSRAIAEISEVKAEINEKVESVPSNITQEVDHAVESSKSEISQAFDGAQTAAIGAATVGEISVNGENSFSSEEPDAPFVVAYDDFRNGSLKQFLGISAGFNNDVSEIALKLKSCFDSQRDFLSMASRSKEPAPADLPALLKPMSENISSVTEFAEKNRRSKQWNHLSAVSSGIGAVGWVAVQPTPGPFVKDMLDSSLFYSNKVLKEFKGVDETQVNWCKSLTGIFNELIAYIKQYHTTGVSWNPQGSVATVPAAAPQPSAGGPPPPPPPPPVSEDSDGPVTSAGGDDRSALFSSLNQGADVTKGLKKVSDDMKTHKNPSLRQGPAPFKANKAPSPVFANKPFKSVTPAKPPKTELQGDKKWIVEYHTGNPSIVISETNMKQVIYIYKCNQSSIQVKGKVNSVVVDSCKKVAVVVDGVVSSLEFVNCQSVQGQVMGKAPTISIDKTDGCMVYLSKESLDANIVTAKSSEMNILVPKGDGDYTEFPVPEQFKTTWNGKSLVTEMADVA